MLSVKMRQTKFGDDAEAKKILAETTQLLESVLVQSSKHTLTSETLKTKLRKVLEKLQELSKENGKDDTELRDFAARFDRLDTTVQLQQGAVSLETAQLESRAAVETKDEEAVESGQARCVEP